MILYSRHTLAGPHGALQSHAEFECRSFSRCKTALTSQVLNNLETQTHFCCIYLILRTFVLNRLHRFSPSQKMCCIYIFLSRLAHKNFQYLKSLFLKCQLRFCISFCTVFCIVWNLWLIGRLKYGFLHQSVSRSVYTKSETKHNSGDSHTVMLHQFCLYKILLF